MYIRRWELPKFSGSKASVRLFIRLRQVLFDATVALWHCGAGDLVLSWVSLLSSGVAE
jgi:hypothetical protein